MTVLLEAFAFSLLSLSLSFFKQEVVLLSCFQRRMPMCSHHPVCFTSILGHELSEGHPCFVFLFFNSLFPGTEQYRPEKGITQKTWNLSPQPIYPHTPAAVSSRFAIPSAARNP